MIVLDTNVLSEGDRPSPDPSVLKWFRRQDPLALYVCGPVLMEQSYGAEIFHLRTGSDRHLKTFGRMVEQFRGRTLDFAGDCPAVAGRIRAFRERAGKPISSNDSMIAAICIVHGAILATRNVRDFDGLDLKLVNPFEPVT